MSFEDVSCAACVRRTQLLAEVAGRLEIAHRQRRPIRAVLGLGDDALIDAVGGGPELCERLVRASAFDLLAAAADAGLEVLCRHTADYPAPLQDDAAPPAALYVRGGPDARSRLVRLVGGAVGPRPPAVAIVGTRRASPEGLEIARRLGRGLAGVGVTVVSGMALGIDGAGVRGAVEAGGPTVAVLAGGADVPYPTRKAGLYDAILATGGAIVSEMPPGFRAFRWNFPARNRIIAALAPATIVIEAAERSGSLITAELALELGRDVAAVPGPVLSWRSRGTNGLLRDGATLVRDLEDAAELILGVEGAAAALKRAAVEAVPAPQTLRPELRTLLSAVEDGRDSLGSLTPDIGRAAAVRAGLVELELMGLIRRAAGGRVLRTTRAVAS